MIQPALDAVDGTLLGGRYRLGQQIGRGGMAVVYRAQDEVLGRPVAVKVFPGAAADKDEGRRRSGEIALLAKLNHPGLVTLYDSGTDSSASASPYLVMELVDGSTLRAHIDRMGRCGSHEVVSLGIQLADALAYVHAAGAVHRDVKPANILLLAHHDRQAASAWAKLTDFGIARLIDGTRLTSTGTTLGTASYLSPEQAAGGAIGPASDVYSLGLVLLEALSGERAFPGTPDETTAARLHHCPPVPAELGATWASLLSAMTAMEPRLRPTALEVTETLRTEITGPQSSASASSVLATMRPAPSPPRRRVPEPVARAVAWARLRSAGLRRRRRRAVGLLVGVIGVAVTAIGAMASPAPEPLVYPTVSGRLGAALEQLQQSVQP